MDVKSIIKEKGFTVEQVAKEMGITRFTLAQNLSGNPTMKTLHRIARVLNCNIGDFFRDEVNTNFIAMIKTGKKMYSASSLEELEEVITKLKEQ